MDGRDEMKSHTAARDGRAGLLSLLFLQAPSLAVSQDRVTYVVETALGPEIELRKIERDPDGKIRSLGAAQRLELHRLGILSASTLAISPDQTQLAFVGLTTNGWNNVYVTQPLLEEPAREFKKLTDEHYNWKSLTWNSAGILAASNRTTNGKYGVFRLDPATGESTQITFPAVDQESPEASGEDFVFTTYESGSGQAHRQSKGENTQLTDVPTNFLYPKIRGGSLYGVIFHHGRFHLVTHPVDQLLRLPPSPERVRSGAPNGPWRAELAFLPEGQLSSYKPFSSSGTRIDGLGAFFATGSAFGVGATISDLMRDYSVSLGLSILGSVDRTDAFATITSQRGRSSWTLGAYHVLIPSLDTLFRDNVIRTYTHREFGVLGALQYPVNVFSYLEMELRFAGVNRQDFSDPVLLPQFEALNPGLEFLIAPTVRLGYDRIIYNPFAGPIEGPGALLESSTSYYPGRSSVTQTFRLDASYYQRVAGTSVLAFQTLGAAAFGESFPNSFLISSDDILRAYGFLDNRLLGNYVIAGKTEFRFPIGTVFRFPPLRGLLFADIGSVFRDRDEIGLRVSSSYGAGLNLNIPPLSLAFIVAKPVRVAPGPEDNSVTHFTLRYLYL